MKSIIRQNTGIVELLIIFPLFLGMLCVIAWIGFFIIQKTKMEKDAWTVQTKKTYQIESNIKNINTSYFESSNQSLDRIWKLARDSTIGLPITFKGYVIANGVSNDNLELHGNIPEVIQHFYGAAFNGQKNITEYILKTEISSSGSPMSNSFVVKNGMWVEAMNSAEFDYKNLKNLGYNELSEAGIPVGFIGKAVGYFEDLKEATK